MFQGRRLAIRSLLKSNMRSLTIIPSTGIGVISVRFALRRRKLMGLETVVVASALVNKPTL